MSAAIISVVDVAVLRVALAARELVDGSTTVAERQGRVALSVHPAALDALREAIREMGTAELRAQAAKLAADAHAKTAERSMHRRNEAHHRNTED